MYDTFNALRWTRTRIGALGYIGAMSLGVLAYGLTHEGLMTTLRAERIIWDKVRIQEIEYYNEGGELEDKKYVVYKTT